MKKARVLTLALTLCLILTVFCPSAVADSAPDISARNAIVMDMSSGTVLYEKDADGKAEPASTTKIMTMLLVCEALERGDVSLDDQVSAKEADLRLGDDDASTVKIKGGEVLSLRDLCYCAMLVSANDACNVIASHVAGSVSQFVQLMNDRAAELGCTGTHFVNTNGLPSAQHYTTARELAVITTEALKHDTFREFCGTTEYTVPATDVSKARPLSNSNALINANACYGDNYLYEGSYGVKTGHTDAAGYCLVSAVKADDLDLLSVVLGSDGDSVNGKYFNNFGDTIKLLDYCRENWHNSLILGSDEALWEIPVKMGVKKQLTLSPAEGVRRVLPADYDLNNLKRDISVNEDFVTAPISKGTVLGQVIVSTPKGEILSTTDLVASTDVHASFVAYALADAWQFASSHLIFISALVLVLIISAFLAIYIPHKKKGKKKK